VVANEEKSGPPITVRLQPAFGQGLIHPENYNTYNVTFYRLVSSDDEKEYR
jgi:hypothetical protein